MSWSDLFYPGNPERREKLVRKSQELQELMKNNFRATNQLIETLKKHLSLSFSPVTLDEKATVKKNCDVLIERIHEIQEEVKKIDEKLKETLEPTLYERLKNMTLSFPEHKIVSGIVHAVCGVAWMSSTLVVCWLIKNATVLTNVTLTLGVIGKGIFASFAIGLIFTAIDVIVQAILGSIERDQLEHALKEYDRALEEFRPASEKYQDSITYVRIRLEMTEKEECH